MCRGIVRCEEGYIARRKRKLYTRYPSLQKARPHAFVTYFPFRPPSRRHQWWGSCTVRTGSAVFQANVAETLYCAGRERTKPASPPPGSAKGSAPRGTVVVLVAAEHTS
eukprot:8962017-Pyramimonas_sp.AAC.1